MNISMLRGTAGRNRLSTRQASWLRARSSERGATAVEYGLMVGLIAVVIVGAVTLFGQGVSALLTVPAGVFGG